MRKIIWTCWFQGLDQAPELVRACIASWRAYNPGWDLRCLDAGTIARYVDLAGHVDLQAQEITAASLSDILRVLLLHEYGGVWVDATTFCNAPLDDWIGPATQSGFFAFARPAADREIASWFLAARPGSRLMAAFAARALAYWKGRRAARDYYWLHHQFGELLAMDPVSAADWRATPQISADGPHSVQRAGFASDFETVRERVDWSSPLFKLTYRYDGPALTSASLLTRLLGETGKDVPAPPAAAGTGTPLPVAHLRVGTENLGDHVQIIAGEQMLARAGFAPGRYVDRDDEIADAPPAGRAGILLNGWFKTNPAQWPPHPDYVPLYLGFHIRLFQAPSLAGPEALAHYRAHGPVGCRDRYTLSLLRGKGVEADLSHCLTMSFPRRLPDPETQTEVFVVSRDERLRDYLPEEIGPYTFINHYSGDRDFAANMDRARALLETYRSRARLIVTTLLHCALPAIAMGIPVVVFYPPNQGAARDSDLQRFSSLADLVPVHDLADARRVDWRGACPDVGGIKLSQIDRFLEMAGRWGKVGAPRLDGIAPPSALPVPEDDDVYAYLDDPERLERFARAGVPDRQRWGATASYCSTDAAPRAQLAARFIADGARVLEVGAGAGALRDQIAGRCNWTGTDLQPVLAGVRPLNLESDPLPEGDWDVIVMLGVLEYIHDTAGVMAKLFGGAGRLVMTYCLPRSDMHTDELMRIRRARGWVNALTQAGLLAHAASAGFELVQAAPVNSAQDFEQMMMVFARPDA